MNVNANEAGRPAPAEGGPDLRIGGALSPVPPDRARAGDRLRDLAAAADGTGLARLARFCRAGRVDGRRLGAALDLSPYLNSIVFGHPEWLDRLFDEDAAARIEALLAKLRELPSQDMTEAGMMTALREAKLEAGLLIGLRDLFGAADAARTTADLSDLADAAVGAALRLLLADLGRRGLLALPDRSRPEEGCGLFVLGMGKLGGRELNYSSDIDLIVLFEPEAAAVVDPDESVEMFSRLVRRLIRILSDRTGDGYVFRTDLRLRPDPGAMPLAIPVLTALTYYEDRGRNWERAAMLKARGIAGDGAAADRFLSDIAPFVWRKYLDFNAVSEIQSMKRRIDAHRGFAAVGVLGHNVKLGPGGIREVEFFAQAQQLIAGGRSPILRTRRTDEALRALAEVGWISRPAAARMLDAYWFLRRVEHMIQMIADEQSHTLPDGADGLSRIAGLMAYGSAKEFEDDLLRHLSFVEARFDDLFREASVGEDRLSSLVENQDVEGLTRALGRLGFARPEASARLLAEWGGGRYRAMRSAPARRHFGDVLPELLESFAVAPDPDGALVAFDRFLAGLPSGLQLFALLSSNPRLLALLTLIVTASPRLADTISRRPHVFDALIDPALFREAPTRMLLVRTLDGFMTDAGGYEDRLVRLRLFAAERRFLVGARLLSGAPEGGEAGPRFSDIADLAIDRVLSTVETDFAACHGRIPGGRVALFGMGRLGSRELTAGSDVDLILFYDHPETALDSGGEKPLPPSTYYTRLTQRLIAALSAPMREGVLYDVDFRLRPSGNKGPLATHVDAFRRYQASEARTWERMALTRSRFLSGDAAFGREIAESIREILAGPADEEELGRDVVRMRALIEREKAARGPLDLKLRAGGVIDLEFLAQWAILTGRAPLDAVGHPTAEILEALDRRTGGSLADAMRRLTRVLHLLRLGPDGAFETAALPPRLADRIAEALGSGGSASIAPAVEAIAEEVRREIRRLLPEAVPD